MNERQAGRDDRLFQPLVKSLKVDDILSLHIQRGEEVVDLADHLALAGRPSNESCRNVAFIFSPDKGREKRVQAVRMLREHLVVYLLSRLLVFLPVRPSANQRRRAVVESNKVRATEYLLVALVKLSRSTAMTTGRRVKETMTSHRVNRFPHFTSSSQDKTRSREQDQVSSSASRQAPP
eukprot:426638-Hanusia_phi.AAC.1